MFGSVRRAVWRLFARHTKSAPSTVPAVVKDSSVAAAGHAPQPHDHGNDTVFTSRHSTPTWHAPDVARRSMTANRNGVADLLSMRGISGYDPNPIFAGVRPSPFPSTTSSSSSSGGDAGAPNEPQYHLQEVSQQQPPVVDHDASAVIAEAAAAVATEQPATPLLKIRCIESLLAEKNISSFEDNIKFLKRHVRFHHLIEECNLAQAWHVFFLTKQIDCCTVGVYNAMFRKIGFQYDDAPGAYQLFIQMKQVGIRPNSECYTILMQAYARVGDMKGIAQLCTHMPEDDIKWGAIDFMQPYSKGLHTRDVEVSPGTAAWGDEDELEPERRVWKQHLGGREPTFDLPVMAVKRTRMNKAYADALAAHTHGFPSTPLAADLSRATKTAADASDESPFPPLTPFVPLHPPSPAPEQHHFAAEFAEEVDDDVCVEELERALRTDVDGAVDLEEGGMGVNVDGFREQLRPHRYAALKREHDFS